MKPVRMTAYGPGDPITFPATVAHINDPRAEDCGAESTEDCPGCRYSGRCELQDHFAAQEEAAATEETR